MNIKEIECKNCMTKSKLTDYVINPYTGCSHGCVYCYADFIRRFQNITEKWGEFVYAKINCPTLLKNELEKNKAGHIFMSSVCDCYMPIEKEYKLTRRILEVIAESKFRNKFEVEILTKSTLAKRDFGLFEKLNLEFGMSIGIIDDNLSKIFEPFASLPSERIKTLKEASEHRIKTFGFISPVLPEISDLEETFKKLKEANVEYVWVELINIKKSVLNRIMPLVKEKLPEKYAKFKNEIDNYEQFTEKIRKQARELEKKYNLKIKEIVVHNE